MRYTVAFSPEDIAQALIQDWFSITNYISRITPPARVQYHGAGIRFKFTPIGKKYRHHVYVDSIIDPRNDWCIFILRPKYPLYLVAVMLAFTTIGLFPVVAIESGEHEIRGIMVTDYNRAVSLATSFLEKYEVLAPRYFSEEEGAAFEGTLRRTPVGLVAFIRDKEHFPAVDVIVEHEEDDLVGKQPGVAHPWEVTRDIARKILLNMIQSTEQKKKRSKEGLR